MVDTLQKETLSVRDAKGFTGAIQYYVSGTGADAAAAEGNARANALAIANLISPLTNAALQEARGPFYAHHPLKRGDMETYVQANYRLELYGTFANGDLGHLGIPCPVLDLFLADEDTPDLANLSTGVEVGPGDSTLASWGGTHGTGNAGDLFAFITAITNATTGVKNRNGSALTQVYGGALVKSKDRRKFSITTLSANLAGPGV